MSPYEFVPYLSVVGADEAVAYYSKVFGIAPELLLNMPDGRVMHCEFRIEGARFFVSEELLEHGGTPSPRSLKGTSVAIHLYVGDCDAIVERMVSLGGQLLIAPADMFWGERFSRVRDPFGHEWGITTRLRAMSPREIQEAAQALFEGKVD